MINFLFDPYNQTNNIEFKHNISHIHSSKKRQKYFNKFATPVNVKLPYIYFVNDSITLPCYFEGISKIEFIKRNTKPPILSINETINHLYHDNEKELFEYLSFIDYFKNMYNLSHDNPHHDESISTHTYLVIEEIRKLDFSKEDLKILLLAGLFHDIGKPIAKKYLEKKKYHVFHDHDIISSKIAYEILFNSSLTDEELVMIYTLCYLHMFFLYNEPKRIKNNLSNRTLNLLKGLNEADKKGRIIAK